MVRTIIQYPTPLSVEYATDVRIFDETLFALIEDLKDTINENNLDALSAYQIGSYYNVVIVKDDSGEFIEMINPRLISHSGTIITDEQTAYYPDKSAEIQRYDKISVVYQDRNGNDKSMQASGEFSIRIQRKIDYTFGATFVQKMSKEEKEKFEKNLENGINSENADYCPTIFHRDKILKLINMVMLLMLLPLVASFFIENKQTLQSLWMYQLYTVYGVICLNVVYFFYAQYEGKLHIACDSCQLGNIVATTVISLVKLAVIVTASYFLLHVI
ncbi:peptide deformylase [Sulfurimonas autotrophica]|uniref:Formylmethionine deformylase n=1 Tax=Sulfurimonas autotrophica (strain ATCC BAA-671 / DSM 16294 / JCM 11897 / OK10) TaxID=563040 RepID=E0UV06_SULAO|nr:peptide deformylase [Sulfurimonas autotrophica]ADN09588.1 formylmethionine deformylase [Sulfurimonas autotrophica DSM 16294]